MSRGYLRKGQTIDEKIREIAEHSENILKKPGFADKLEKYIRDGHYVIPTPVWKNFNPTSKESPISCFGVFVDDSVESILMKAAEVGIQNKIGGGSSGYFGKIRPRGAHIAEDGQSNGSVSMMEIYETISTIISQPNRRGHFSATQDIEHFDSNEFLRIRSEGHAIQDLSFCVSIGDKFMEDLLSGNEENIEKLRKVVKCRFETGFPYIFFKDTVNDNTVDIYRDLGMRIWHTNMCITGDQRVVTGRGYLKAEDLYRQGGTLDLTNGHKRVFSTEMKLREKDADVFKITLSNGLEQKMTSSHGVPVLVNRKIERVECKDLKIGDRVAVQTEKGIFGTKSMKDEAFLLGLYQSDGTQHKDIIMLDVWENDFDIIEEVQHKFNNVHYKYKCDKYSTTNQHGSTFSVNNKPAIFRNCATGYSNIKKKRLASKTLKKALNFEKGYIPDWIWESDEATQWEYVRGLLIADGTAGLSENSPGSPIHISYSEINLDFIKELQLLFNNLGLQSSIGVFRQAEKTMMPDGKGGQKLYDTKTCYRLSIGNKNAALEVDKRTGFLKRKNIVIEDKTYRDNTKKAFKIISIEHVGKEDVYCPTVNNEEHIFVSNGVKTFNCTEICLPNSVEETFVCNLLGMDATTFDSWTEDVVEVGIYFMDSMLTDFIIKNTGNKLMRPAVRFAERHRAMGLGLSGLHSYLQSKSIPFESMEAKFENVKIFKRLKEDSYRASEKMALEYGKPEILKDNKYKRRHSTLGAVAPNTSSAFIKGQQSQSTELYVSNYYIKDVAKTRISLKNPYLEKVLEDLGKNTEEVWDSILKKSGSVQHLSFLSDHDKKVFKTFGETSQMEVLLQASARQNFIDQSQSLNLMIPSNATPEDVAYLIIKAWQLDIKTLYYQLNVSAVQEFGKSITECESCAA